MEAFAPIIPHITSVNSTLTLMLLFIVSGLLIPKRFYDDLKNLYEELAKVFSTILDLVKRILHVQNETHKALTELSHKMDQLLEARDDEQVS